MISIKQLFGRPEDTAASATVRDANSQFSRLRADGTTARCLLEQRARTPPDAGPSTKDLLARLEAKALSLKLVDTAKDPLEASASQTQSASGHLREQDRWMQSMVAMLTKTVADVSGQSHAAVARLQEVKRQIERASGLNDIQHLRASLATCLEAVENAAVQQRSATLATVEDLQDHIERAHRPAAGGAAPSDSERSRVTQCAPEAEYLAVFKLHRADHIIARLGKASAEQMSALLGDCLKAAQGPKDHLVRWKGGPSFIELLTSSESELTIRKRLSKAVANVSRCYMEIGTKSALLAVGVDWCIFPLAQYQSPDAAFSEVDWFLGESKKEGAP